MAFEEALRERCAERIVPFRFGRAVFNDTFSSVYELNVLRVDRPDGATVETLAVEAEHLHGEAGHRHRRVMVSDEEAGERLAPGFRELGWKVNRFVFMAWRESGVRRGNANLAEEVEPAEQRRLRERIVAAEPWASSEQIVRMVLDSALLVAKSGRARHFGVRVDGEVVSATDLFSDGRTAQVEDVATTPEHRGKGYASALVVHAVLEAERTGHDFVFLVADDEDWPKELYARLGFAPLGRKWAFLKAPAPAAPA